MRMQYEALERRECGGMEHRVIGDECDMPALVEELVQDRVVHQKSYHFIVTGTESRTRCFALQRLFGNCSDRVRVDCLSLPYDNAQQDHCLSVVLRRLTTTSPAERQPVPNRLQNEAAQLREDFARLRAEAASLMARSGGAAQKL